jgi:hypothetical protein
MMYRHHTEQPSRPKRSYKGLFTWVLCAVGVLTIAGLSLASLKARNSNADKGLSFFSKGTQIQRHRLLRSEIPPLDVTTMVYSKLFGDTNATQLESAVRNGVKHPESITDPAKCSELVPVTSNDLYWMDSMDYSIPYLVPEAALLLQHIAARFQEVMKENYPNDPHTYRLVVTSCFRSQEHVDQLLRCNRNASENSCHRYGTTMDISYKRFLTEQGDTVNELFLKQMLAKTLYELRYEGLCWVKYEHRQACFHLTLRNKEYTGNQKSEVVTYILKDGVMKKKGSIALNHFRQATPPEPTKKQLAAQDNSQAKQLATTSASPLPMSVNTMRRAPALSSYAADSATMSFSAPALNGYTRASLIRVHKTKEEEKALAAENNVDYLNI